VGFVVLFGFCCVLGCCRFCGFRFVFCFGCCSFLFVINGGFRLGLVFVGCCVWFSVFGFGLIWFGLNVYLYCFYLVVLLWVLGLLGVDII